jgi:hypothetical protein
MQPSEGAEIPKSNFGFCDLFSPLLQSLNILDIPGPPMKMQQNATFDQKFI